jgi:hypothetical protein
MKLSRMGYLLWVSMLLLLAPAGFAQDALESGFRNPPPQAKPHTWWHWVNGNISREGITADLEAMKRAGLGGAQIFNVDVGIPAGPVPFMSPQWREMFRYAVQEADRLGLEICIHNCAGWSSSGGPWITPEHAMQRLVWTRTTVRGPAHFSEILAQPSTRAGYYRDIAVLAFRTPEGEASKPLLSNLPVKAGFDRADRLLPDTSPTPPGAAVPRDEIVNLTDRMDAEGRLTWDAPDGEWTVLRIGYTPTGAQNAPAPPEGRGLECDKLSREGLDAHWAGIMDKIISDLGPLTGQVFNNALIDSYEVGCQNWTPKLREEFQKRRGYDPLPFLPVIAGQVVDSVEVSERFLWDFRRTLCDLWADNYYGYFAELCHKHGMKASAEPYGNGVFDNIQSGGTVDIPMGEFWVGGGAEGTAKLAASIAHTYGRRLAGAESFTADDRRGRWLVDPYSIKALGDAIFCSGVNRYIFHRYAHQPWMNLEPGMTMGPWGTHFERTVTWWNQGAAWLRYVARCQYLLQAGRFVADACFFEGESGPNDLPGRGTLPQGYDYDGCDTVVLMRRMAVENGRIVLPDGMSYRLLVLPDSPFMTPPVLRKVRELVQAGATVVGPKPSKSPSLVDYPRCDEEVRRIADEVWGNCDGKTITEHAFGKGRVFWGPSLAEIVTKIGVKPDFEYKGVSRYARLVYIHRTANGAEVYFVSNQKYQPEEVECVFRAGGRVPELWHPDTGVIETAPVYREQGGRTSVTLRLDPAGSVFVVFRRRNTRPDHLISVARSGAAVPKSARPRLEIRKAFYEPADGRPGADVTAKVAALVADGQYSIPATNEVFGDPTPLIVKQLRVEYVLDGKPMQKTVGENETLDLAESRESVTAPAFELKAAGGAVALMPFLPGTYQARTARGRTVKVAVREAARTLAVNGGWALRFPSGRGAPEHVQLDKLISWTEHDDPGVRYFSGTAEYTKTFDVPANMTGAGRALYLDLGRVKNLAEVTLNGKKLGVLWKAPFRLDVTGLVRPGRNTLAVRVTNLWPNRLIGDVQLPPDVEWAGDHIARWPQWLIEGKPRPKTGHYTFTTWRFFNKDSPLLESGLLGPVTLQSARKVTLR